MIQAHNLSKSYGAVEALRAVAFQIDDGEIVGLLGPNGAGKTTIIKILTGYLEADEGYVMINGLDVATHRQQVQAEIGYLPENTPLYPELTVQAYLKLMADLHLVPSEDADTQIAEAVHATGLTDRLTQPIGQLSKGYRQRVGLAQAILHKPNLLILDEPTIGLDPTQIVEIRNLIRRLSQHCAIFFSTHILSEVETLCDRVIILMNGQVRADARISELAATNNAILVLDSAIETARDSLLQLLGVQDVKMETAPSGHPLYRVIATNSQELGPAIYRLAKERDWPVRELRNDTRALESVFNELTLSTGQGPDRQSAVMSEAREDTLQEV